MRLRSVATDVDENVEIGRRNTTRSYAQTN
eukprot:GSMAST32.ASY1.ANO1.1494.1 assembled CDS